MTRKKLNLDNTRLVIITDWLEKDVPVDLVAMAHSIECIKHRSAGYTANYALKSAYQLGRLKGANEAMKEESSFAEIRKRKVVRAYSIAIPEHAPAEIVLFSSQGIEVARLKCWAEPDGSYLKINALASPERYVIVRCPERGQLVGKPGVPVTIKMGRDE